jgi:membrane fusion protein, copper/silver efflux system
MKKFILFPLLITSLVFVSCAEDTRTTETEETTEQTAESILPSNVENDLQDLLREYYELKEALVEAKPEEGQTTATQMQRIIERIEAGEVDGLQEKLNSLKNHLQMLAESGNLDEQRTHFEPVSDEMYDLVREYRFNDHTVYRQYCPMAFNDKGAYWLSDEEPIRNPYFGDLMLQCGSVEETIAE